MAPRTLPSPPGSQPVIVDTGRVPQGPAKPGPGRNWGTHQPLVVLAPQIYLAFNKRK